MEEEFAFEETARPCDENISIMYCNGPCLTGILP
jgi:hypothetical protein